MSDAAERVMAAALQLPEEERVAVAEALLGTVAAPPGFLSANDAGFDAVLRRRLEDYEAGRVAAVPGNEFLRRLRERT